MPFGEPSGVSSFFDRAGHDGGMEDVSTLQGGLTNVSSSSSSSSTLEVGVEGSECIFCALEVGSAGVRSFALEVEGGAGVRSELLSS